MVCEPCDGENNFLWSTIWDDGFTQNEDYKLFAERLRPFGYENKIKESIFEEGVLSGIVTEVLAGMKTQRVVTEGITVKAKTDDAERQ